MSFMGGGAGAGGLAAGNPWVGAALLGAGLLMNLLFPQKIYGPRADSLKVSTVKYGEHLARLYGTCRIAGHCVWVKGDQLSERVNEASGKGGPKLITYSYTSTCMYVFTFNGPASALTKIWLDDKLFYDNGAINLEGFINDDAPHYNFVVAGLNVDIYLGTDDEAPDWEYVEDKGEDYCPAYKNIVKVVFRGLPHDDFGVRMPNCEAEIIQVGTPAYLINMPLDITLPYTGGLQSNVGSPQTGYVALTLANINVIDMNVGGINTWSNASTSDNGEALIGINGIIYTADDYGAFYSWDAPTGAYLGLASSALSASPIVLALLHGTLHYPEVGQSIFFVIPLLGGYHFYATTGTGLLHDDSNTFSGVFAGLDLIRAFIHPASPSLGYAVGNLAPSLRYNAVFTADYATPGATISQEIVNTKFGYSALNASIYTVWTVQADNTVVFSVAPDVTINPTPVHLVKVDAGFNVISDVMIGYHSMSGWEQEINSDGTVGMRLVDSGGGNPTLNVVNLITMTIEESFLEADWPVGYTYFGLMYFATLRAFYLFGSGVTYKGIVYLPRISPDKVPVADIMAAESLLVGITADVTEVSPLTRGYAVRQETTPRAVIEDLARVYHTDFTQIDGVLTFWDKLVSVGKAVSKIHEGAFQNDKPAKYFVVEKLDSVLKTPNSLSLKYIAFDSDYRTGAQPFGLPVDADVSLADAIFETSTVLEEDEVMGILSTIYDELKSGIFTWETSLPQRYIDIFPGEVVSLVLDNDDNVQGFIERMEMDEAIEIVVRKRDVTYDHSLPVQPTPNVPNSAITTGIDSYFVGVDSHMLRDIDDDSMFYFGVYIYPGLTFSVSQIVQSRDGGATYSNWDAQTQELNYGICASILRDLGTESPYIPHRADTLDFSLYSGTAPSTQTEDNFIAGSMPFMVSTSAGEWEICFGKTITDNGGGSYTITGIVRGVNGTEILVGEHAVGDQIIFPDALSMDRSVASYLTESNYYASISAGRPFRAGLVRNFQNYGRSKRPFRPAHILGVRDTGATEDLTLTWVRQSRFSYQWLDGTDTVPLNEASEEYEIDYYEGVTLLRTRLALTTPTDTYTLAQYQTDSGNGGATVIPTLNVSVFQISDTFGRGVQGDATI